VNSDFLLVSLLHKCFLDILNQREPQESNPGLLLLLLSSSPPLLLLLSSSSPPPPLLLVSSSSSSSSSSGQSVLLGVSGPRRR